MIVSVKLEGKRVAVQLTRAATSALARRSQPLMAEVHLIFGCMVAKRVWFTERLRPEAEVVLDGLSICFRPVRYARSCRIDGVDKGAASPDYPVVGPKVRFVPDIVTIDFRAGNWVGDFTYDRQAASRLHGNRSTPPAAVTHHDNGVPISGALGK